MFCLLKNNLPRSIIENSENSSNPNNCFRYWLYTWTGCADITWDRLSIVSAKTMKQQSKRWILTSHNNKRFYGLAARYSKTEWNGGLPVILLICWSRLLSIYWVKTTPDKAEHQKMITWPAVTTDQASFAFCNCVII